LADTDVIFAKSNEHNYWVVVNIFPKPSIIRQTVLQRLKIAIPLIFMTLVAPRLGALQGESVYAKVIVGGAYMYVSETIQDVTLSLSGISGVSYLYVGGSLNKSFKVFGFTGLAIGPKPQAKIQNLSIDTNYSTQTILDLGLGAAYYLKSGTYFSLGGSIAQNHYKYSVYGSSVSSYTRHGWGSHLLAGHEFPVSPRLSLGVSGIIYYGQVADTGPAPFDNTTISNFYSGVVFSVTYD
jgi:hypothetical protein